jgi:4-alpha-glucanotransferase
VSALELRQLRQLARLEGIQLSYINAAGNVQEASTESLRATLSALGIPLEKSSDVTEALRAARAPSRQQGLEPVTVAWASGKPTVVSVRLPGSTQGQAAQARLILENGARQELRLIRPPSPNVNSAKVAADSSIVRQLVLPVLPHGYHKLEVETANSFFHSLVISAPVHSYATPEPSRCWGVFLPIYALHSRESWGAGNLRDWQRFSHWVGALGGDVVGTLPLLATFLDRPTCAPSPYSPVSRLFWNEFYLDVLSVPELSTCRKAQRLIDSTAFQRRLAGFRHRREIDYASQAAARRTVLEVLAQSFFLQDSPRRREFQQALREQAEMEAYARFRAACDRTNAGWQSWPDRQCRGKLTPSDYREEDKRYHLYVQWLARRQMEAATASCRAGRISFYLDLPLGVHPDGYDVWREQDLFALGASAGAPPDRFFSRGQDWGFPPLHPRRTREQHYRYVIEYLRFQMRHTGMLRIDHVMGLHRLYWVPRGLPPTQGAYVSYPAEELYALLCLESHRHQTTLVGENLGTVPPEVNAGMKRHQLRQMFVLPFEQRPDPRQALRPVPARCVASMNTHDMPSFHAHWTGKDIADRAALGLFQRGELRKERERRRLLNAALIRFLQRQGCLRGKHPKTAAVLRASLRWLSASPAEMVVINLEDLWLEPLPQNVPGTSNERPNWRRKAAFPLEDIEKMAEVRDILHELDHLRKA